MLAPTFRQINAVLFLILAAGFFGGLLPLRAAEAPLRARVVRASDPHAVHLLTPDPVRVRRLMDAAILKFTGQADLASAWRSVVQPSDRVGIKIQTASGPVVSTHREVVNAVVEGLHSAGVPLEHILIFDRYGIHMDMAGFHARSGGPVVASIIPGSGYDPAVTVDLAIPGKLIWGDLEFKEQPEKQEVDQVSTKSHFASILTRQVDKLINISTLMSDVQLGLYGCQLNASLSLVDNFRRLRRPGPSREDSLTEIFAQPVIRKKCVLHILDGLIGQFAGGPGFDPDYCWAHQTLYVSTDAVAIDTLALEQINRQRARSRVLPATAEAPYIQAAAEARLGVADPERITVVDVSP